MNSPSTTIASSMMAPPVTANWRVRLQDLTTAPQRRAPIRADNPDMPCPNVRREGPRIPGTGRPAIDEGPTRDPTLVQATTPFGHDGPTRGTGGSETPGIAFPSRPEPVPRLPRHVRGAFRARRLPPSG
ncbi:hypothetical protein J4G37_08305 [Microvirga sp. 3-52]|nr:hypothetical protein [Microvirga sp. 3-52]